jgi:hypothetical protein
MNVHFGLLVFYCDIDFIFFLAEEFKKKKKKDISDDDLDLFIQRKYRFPKFADILDVTVIVINIVDIISVSLYRMVYMIIIRCNEVFHNKIAILIIIFLFLFCNNNYYNN